MQSLDQSELTVWSKKWRNWLQFDTLSSEEWNEREKKVKTSEKSVTFSTHIYINTFFKVSSVAIFRDLFELFALTRKIFFVNTQV